MQISNEFIDSAEKKVKNTNLQPFSTYTQFQL